MEEQRDDDNNNEEEEEEEEDAITMAHSLLSLKTSKDNNNNNNLTTSSSKVVGVVQKTEIEQNKFNEEIAITERTIDNINKSLLIMNTTNCPENSNTTNGGDESDDDDYVIGNLDSDSGGSGSDDEDDEFSDSDLDDSDDNSRSISSGSQEKEELEYSDTEDSEGEDSEGDYSEEEELEEEGSDFSDRKRAKRYGELEEEEKFSNVRREGTSKREGRKVKFSLLDAERAQPAISTAMEVSKDVIRDTTDWIPTIASPMKKLPGSLGSYERRIALNEIKSMEVDMYFTESENEEGDDDDDEKEDHKGNRSASRPSAGPIARRTRARFNMDDISLDELELRLNALPEEEEMMFADEDDIYNDFLNAVRVIDTDNNNNVADAGGGMIWDEIGEDIITKNNKKNDNDDGDDNDDDDDDDDDDDFEEEDVRAREIEIKLQIERERLKRDLKRAGKEGLLEEAKLYDEGEVKLRESVRIQKKKEIIALKQKGRTRIYRAQIMQLRNQIYTHSQLLIQTFALHACGSTYADFSLDSEAAKLNETLILEFVDARAARNRAMALNDLTSGVNNLAPNSNSTASATRDTTDSTVNNNMSRASTIDANTRVNNSITNTKVVTVPSNVGCALRKTFTSSHNIEMKAVTGIDGERFLRSMLKKGKKVNLFDIDILQHAKAFVDGVKNIDSMHAADVGDWNSARKRKGQKLSKASKQNVPDMLFSRIDTMFRVDKSLNYSDYPGVRGKGALTNNIAWKPAKKQLIQLTTDFALKTRIHEAYFPGEEVLLDLIAPKLSGRDVSAEASWLVTEDILLAQGLLTCGCCVDDTINIYANNKKASTTTTSKTEREEKEATALNKAFGELQRRFLPAKSVQEINERLLILLIPSESDKNKNDALSKVNNIVSHIRRKTGLLNMQECVVISDMLKEVEYLSVEYLDSFLFWRDVALKLEKKIPGGTKIDLENVENSRIYIPCLLEDQYLEVKFEFFKKGKGPAPKKEAAKPLPPRKPRKRKLISDVKATKTAQKVDYIESLKENQAEIPVVLEELQYSESESDALDDDFNGEIEDEELSDSSDDDDDISISGFDVDDDDDDE